MECRQHLHARCRANDTIARCYGAARTSVVTPFFFKTQLGLLYCFFVGHRRWSSRKKAQHCPLIVLALIIYCLAQCFAISVGYRLYYEICGIADLQ